MTVMVLCAMDHYQRMTLKTFTLRINFFRSQWPGKFPSLVLCDIKPMFFYFWADGEDGGPTLKQRWVNVSCKLGFQQRRDVEPMLVQ